MGSPERGLHRGHEGRRADPRSGRSGKKRLEGDPVERFLFRLALLLGKTVHQLQRQLTSTELTKWIAFLELDPPDDPAIWDWRFAMLASVTAQVNGVPRHKAKLESFLPKRKKASSPVHTGSEQARIMAAFTGSVMPDEIAKRFGA